MRLLTILRSALLVLATLAMIFWATSVDRAQTIITVCAANCDFTGLQPAINAANLGDTILLQSGATYTGTFELYQKTGSSYLTIKTGVDASGNVLAASVFPEANVRMTPAYASVLAKIVMPDTANVMAIRTQFPAETGGTCTVGPGCVAHHYKFQYIEFIGNDYGGNNIINLGSQNVSTDCSLPGGSGSCGSYTGGDTQNTLAEEPHHFIIDQCYLHAFDPFKGQARAIQVAARDVTISNSYFENFKAVSDKTAIWVDNSSGNLTVINNYIEGSGENFLSGGDTPRSARNDQAVASAPDVNTIVLVNPPEDYLEVGSGMSVEVGGVKKYTHVTAINGNTISVETLPAVADVPGGVYYSIVPHNLTFQYNYLRKPLEWRGPILDTPIGLTAQTGTTTSGLAAGTYTYRVVATSHVSENQSIRSTASAEISATVGTNGTVTISWPEVPDAEGYDIYGRSAGAENKKFSITTAGGCSGGVCEWTDTNAAGTTANVPTSTGSQWLVKNLFELKKFHTAIVEGNYFENQWAGAQNFAIMMTVLNNSTSVDGNDSTVVRDVTFRYNWIHSAESMINMSCVAADGDISDRTVNMNYNNNIFDDIGTTYGPKFTGLQITTGVNAAYTGVTNGRACDNITYDHNTFVNDQSKAMFWTDLYKAGEQHKIPHLTFTNNFIRKADYGLRALGSGGMVAEGAPTSWELMTITSQSAFKNNVIVGASCSLYSGTNMSGNFCPSESTFQASFQNFAQRNYTVVANYATASLTGTAIGADFATVKSMTDIAKSGDNSGGGGGGGPVIQTPTITTTVLTNTVVGASYSAVLAATGGVSPYTWTVEAGSTLPGGLALSSAGELSGTPTVAGIYTFTVRATGSDTGFTTRELTLTVADVPQTVTNRARFNYTQCATIRSEEEPQPTDDLVIQVCDLWFDTVTSTYYVATETGPTVVWTPLGAEGQPAPQASITIPFYAGSSAASQGVAAGEAEFINSSHHAGVDTTGLTNVVLSMQTVTSSSAGGQCYLQYFDGSLWNTVTGTELVTDANGTHQSGVVLLPAEAQGNLVWRVACSGQSPTAQTVGLTFAIFR